jgi:hypothetical protein
MEYLYMTDAQLAEIEAANLPAYAAADSPVQGAGPASVTDVKEKRFLSYFGKSLRIQLFYLVTGLLVLAGWHNRTQDYLTPEHGIGYALGIIGASLMLLLLLYPLRKYMRWTRVFGPVRHWFRAHMLMGVIGPVCILYHCNFQLGSTNGNIALFSMLLVASSGLVGRYFYTRIHYGLYGQKADLSTLGSDVEMARSHMDVAFSMSPGLREKLRDLDSKAAGNLSGLSAGLVSVLLAGLRYRWQALVLGVELRRAFALAVRQGDISREQYNVCYRKASYWLSVYLGTMRRVAGFSFYERLFSLWHVLHLPLFFMLLISGIVHVYAVHMY